MHRVHADIHEVGLFDDCPGCDELAANPFGNMDDRLISLFSDRAVARASNGMDPSRGVTANDLIAEKNILNVLERIGKLAEVNPAALERYLRGRWHIQCRIMGMS